MLLSPIQVVRSSCSKEQEGKKIAGDEGSTKEVANKQASTVLDAQMAQWRMLK